MPRDTGYLASQRYIRPLADSYLLFTGVPGIENPEYKP